ncbi:hypothetical protein TR51_28645 [Kitasatospora griseola]|uniref:DUF4928 domain-containing protein n=1 Tax=Kitasatospora griseola TaxID=2064 RepID=A0A0D0N436_KITGR|nr:DUF4928 family protein [Kitasatospora griseola]KIQ62870.1 hypothetical protein TR51_28645 [Kitasatospora griseola]
MVSIDDEAAIPARVREAAELLMAAVEPWYEGKRGKKGGVYANVMSTGLYMTEFLAAAFPLEEEFYAPGSQLRNASGGKAKAILAEHGETRKYHSEGARTSRGTIDHARGLAAVINSAGTAAGLGAFDVAERVSLAFLLQQWFVERVREDYFEKKKITAELNPDWSIRAVVASLLQAGRERPGNAAGALAQHLVGAKLKIRFDGTDVEIDGINDESYTTADQQTGRAGDYQLNDTAIHVTMSPTLELFTSRCQDNLNNHFRPRVLVPSDQLARATTYAQDAGIDKLVAIQSIEDFIGTNIEETAGFSQAKVKQRLKELVELYNERIEAAEVDMSLKIEVPDNL